MTRYSRYSEHFGAGVYFIYSYLENPIKSSIFNCHLDKVSSDPSKAQLVHPVGADGVLCHVCLSVCLSLFHVASRADGTCQSQYYQHLSRGWHMPGAQ